MVWGRILQSVGPIQMSPSLIITLVSEMAISKIQFLVPRNLNIFGSRMFMSPSLNLYAVTIETIIYGRVTPSGTLIKVFYVGVLT